MERLGVELIDRENGRKFDISHYIESIRNRVDGYPGRIELNSENTAMGKPKNYSTNHYRACKEMILTGDMMLQAML
ncbi:hypothetical protein OFR22_13200 [Brachyspira hyodysenteriae]|uniref:hypothetical protein n=1 Tax=Brachyspira hyodysenteriae TaxID=159 RepID=UPI0022CE163A|nr:hypothetical protein [Brachyspira hyodysenteriae]MCZ9996335.1 hypothetical protein [Brachyspira hyodysenteriae]